MLSLTGTFRAALRTSKGPKVALNAASQKCAGPRPVRLNSAYRLCTTASLASEVSQKPVASSKVRHHGSKSLVQILIVSS